MNNLLTAGSEMQKRKKKKLTIFPENLCAGEMQAAKETVTRHIGMPVITEENSDEEGTMIEILTNQ